MQLPGVPKRRFPWSYVIAWACVPLSLAVALYLWPNAGTSTAANDSVTISSGPRVLVYGDSISNVARPEVNAALGTRYALTTRVHVGTTHGLSNALREQVALTDPDAVIVELGTSYALAGDEGWQQDFDAILDTVRPINCVAFVTVSPAADQAFSRAHAHEQRDVAAQWNAALKSAVQSDSHFHLVDWGSAATLAPGFVDDGTHPTDKGKVWLIAQYRNVLDQQCHLAITP